MKLLVDMGNTRVKWQLRDAGGESLSAGSGGIDEAGLFSTLVSGASEISAVAVSTVASESRRDRLCERLAAITNAPVRFYWTESRRGELSCAYPDPGTMGVDRWHALYGAWLRCRSALAVVDAGSAITVDFVNHHGQHQGGYIFSGKQMMLRSLRQDAARIGYGEAVTRDASPGTTTTECVHHGLRWLWQAIVRQLNAEVAGRGLASMLVTGGDAPDLLDAGLAAEWVPDLVLDGLAAIDEESTTA
ncbi:MAG: type III pantothenate kinase [Marinobacter sp.]|uniref:type III pantothenate kinase n=1 Tax=Marinobacter sp. TaxID=50741 RepID=UPI00299E3A50|nr:type III pantothenate kinase [Marinobacter sp.]MDX1757880.1 type III pantothenate kinase [Marinobacter sp.]